MAWSYPASEPTPHFTRMCLLVLNHLSQSSEEQLRRGAGPVQEDFRYQSHRHLQHTQQADGQVEAGGTHLKDIQPTHGETHGEVGSTRPVHTDRLVIHLL